MDSSLQIPKRRCLSVSECKGVVVAVASVNFDIENGYSVDFNDQFGTSLSKNKYGYSEIEDWDSYLQEIMSAIELRIPDKFLKAKGWL